MANFHVDRAHVDPGSFGPVHGILKDTRYTVNRIPGVIKASINMGKR